MVQHYAGLNLLQITQLQDLILYKVMLLTVVGNIGIFDPLTRVHLKLEIQATTIVCVFVMHFVLSIWVLIQPSA